MHFAGSEPKPVRNFKQFDALILTKNLCLMVGLHAPIRFTELGFAYSL